MVNSIPKRVHIINRPSSELEISIEFIVAVAAGNKQQQQQQQSVQVASALVSALFTALNVE